MNAAEEKADVKGKAVTVVGGARSGRAVAILLRKAGAEVFLTEQGSASDELVSTLKEHDIQHEFGGHTERALKCDFIALSPGVPASSAIVQQAKAAEIPVYSEIEIASWFCEAPIIAITGTNGKTTTTSLIGHVFKSAGRNAIVAGNIGAPFSDYALDAGADDIVVLEVSSYQLDFIDRFRPNVSVLLNITPDHLDRYDNKFENYVQSKTRIFENQTSNDTLIYNRDDDVVTRQVEQLATKKDITTLAISQQREVPSGAFTRENTIVVRTKNQETELMQIDELALRGQHNLYNSLAAAMAARVMEVGSDSVRESLSSFEGVPHRLELVRERDGIQYVNDSKATNVNALWYALESFTEPIVLIAGGRDKGNDYSQLKPLIRKNVRAVVAMGESAGKVMDELGSQAPDAVRAESMEDAVRKADSFARAGDVVLLSPACSSFDMFDDFEDRGNTFKRIVMTR